MQCDGSCGNVAVVAAIGSVGGAGVGLELPLLPGFGGGLNQSHDAWPFPLPSICSAQATSTASFWLLPLPTFSGEPQSRLAMKPGAGWPVGASGGSEVVWSAWPSEPVFGPQQLPLLPGNSSHQKSTPFGIATPVGARPMTFPWYSLSFDVLEALCGVQGGDPAPGAGVQEIASGTASSIVPRRQLS